MKTRGRILLFAVAFLLGCGGGVAPPATTQRTLPPPPSPATLRSAELSWTGDADLDLEVWNDSGYVREAVPEEEDIRTGTGGSERLVFEGDLASGTHLLAVGFWGKNSRSDTAAATVTVYRSDSTTQTFTGELDRTLANLWFVARVNPDGAGIAPVGEYYQRNP